MWVYPYIHVLTCCLIFIELRKLCWATWPALSWIDIIAVILWLRTELLSEWIKLSSPNHQYSAADIPPSNHSLILSSRHQYPFPPPLQTLSVTVCQAMELPAMDMGGVSDPYVKVWTPGSQDMPCTLVEFHTTKGNTRLALYTIVWLSALCSQTSVWNTQGFLFLRFSSSRRRRGWRSLRRRCTGRRSTPSSTRRSSSRTSRMRTPLTRPWCSPFSTTTDFPSTIVLER